MHWIFSKYIINLFRRNRVKKERSFDGQFDSLVNKHQVSISGDEAYALGRTFTDRVAAATYVEMVLKPRFTNLAADFQAFARDRREEIAGRVETIKGEVAIIETELDLQNEKAEMSVLEKEKKLLEDHVKEIEKIHFPEKQFAKYSGKTLGDYQAAAETISTANEDSTIRETAERQKIIAIFASRQSAKYKKLLDSFRSRVHSLHYPPRRSFIYFLYLACFILLICEVGITMRIARDLYVEPYNNANRTTITLIYSVGISLALAVLYKYLIDIFLFKGWRMGLAFLVCYLLVFIFMSVFFSTDVGQSSGSLITYKKLIGGGGLVLGFLSGNFAMANAFLFREASYLMDLYYKMYPRKSINQLTRAQSKLRKTINKKLLVKNSELLFAGQQLSAFSSTYCDEITGYIKRLESINETSFWLGVDYGMAELVANNHDISLALAKKIKERLYGKD